MDKHLDFTIDFETCSLSANAAPMQVAIVPWMRDAEKDPFDLPAADANNLTADDRERGLGRIQPFVGYVDLRTCVVDGFDFDPETIKWWSEKSDVLFCS